MEEGSSNATVASRREAEPAVQPDERAQGADDTQEMKTGEISRRQAFERLIRGEYKQEFDERVRRIIDKRFREMRSMKEKSERVRPLMEALGKRYGEQDAEKLKELILGETEEKKEAAFASEREKKALQMVYRWQQDAEALHAEHPDFDLQAEMRNPSFSALLRAGIDMKTAYRALHQEEILDSAVRYAARKVREKTISDMAMRSSRPEENGAGGRGGTRVSPLSVENMTRAEREEIERRCARGEKVYFS